MGKGQDGRVVYMDKDKNNLLKFIFCLALLLLAYLPTFIWMWQRWFAKESYYGHGILIPLISLYIIWQRRSRMKEAEVSSQIWAVGIVAAGLLIHIVCALLKVYFISGFSLVLVIYGLILFFWGQQIAKQLRFAIFFLLAMIPLPLVVIGNLTVRLKLFAAWCATFILNKIGFPSICDGSIIRMPASFTVIGAPCSGLRSLISLLTLGIIFSYLMNISYKKKVLLFLSSLPLALMANIFRIILLAIVNDLYGGKVSTGFFHDLSGFLLFGFALTGFFVIARLLERKR